MFLAAYKFLDKASHAPQAEQHRVVGGVLAVCATLAYATWNGLRTTDDPWARKNRVNAELAKQMKK